VDKERPQKVTAQSEPSIHFNGSKSLDHAKTASRAITAIRLAKRVLRLQTNVPLASSVSPKLPPPTTMPTLQSALWPTLVSVHALSSITALKTAAKEPHAFLARIAASCQRKQLLNVLQ
jgi:hypothetical protein